MKFQDTHPLQPGDLDCRGRTIAETFYNDNDEPCFRVYDDNRTYKATENFIAKQGPKPPLGLMPRYIWDYKRASAIMHAIVRYEDAGKTPPGEWIDELRTLLAKP